MELAWEQRLILGNINKRNNYEQQGQKQQVKMQAYVRVGHNRS